VTNQTTQRIIIKFFRVSALTLALSVAYTLGFAPKALAQTATPASEVKPEVKKSADVSLELKYPELMVAPSASKRLEMELANEKKGGFGRYLSFITSGAMTTAAGMMLAGADMSQLDQDTQDRVSGNSTAATLIGGAWIGAIIYLNMNYNPYDTGYKRMGAQQKGASQADIIARERLAEEAIYDAGSFMTKLKWMSFASNFIGGVLVMDGSNRLSSGTGMSQQKIFGGLAVLSSLAPVLFESSWESSANYHRDYKKRIYGPVAGLSMMSINGQTAPAWSLGMSF
jgi:hypothetical protein